MSKVLVILQLTDDEKIKIAFDSEYFAVMNFSVGTFLISQGMLLLNNTKGDTGTNATSTNSTTGRGGPEAENGPSSIIGQNSKHTGGTTSKNKK